MCAVVYFIILKGNNTTNFNSVLQSDINYLNYSLSEAVY